MKAIRWGLAVLLACTSLIGRAQTYNVFQPGGALSGTWNQQNVDFGNPSFFLGSLPAANQQSIASPNFLCNNTGSTGAAGACNPLAAATMMSAALVVDVVAVSNLTLSGLQTIDGVSGFAGEFVLAAAQTTGSQNGIYVMSSGAWARAANFPAGYVIGQNCEVVAHVRLESTYAATHWYIVTTTAVTIGTSTIQVVQE